MARKNYFYPDMPKDFQTTQYDQPTNSEGQLELADGFVVGIERAHISKKTPASQSMWAVADGSTMRCIPWLITTERVCRSIEIVSKPDIRTIDHARNYVEELRAIVVATGVSDARMEEGSIRVDANVSVRPHGSCELRTRCEIKNINSLRSLGRAIEHEALRQIDLWTTGSGPQQQTRHWDEDAGRTTPGRSKEDADDYRYFQEPDLAPLDPTPATIAAIDEAMPPLPAARRAALRAATGAGIDAARLLVERGQDVLAMAAVVAGADGTKAVTRLVNDLAVDDWSKG